MKPKIKGIWFIGYSGSGKTYASKILKYKIKNSILIDGDEVRNLVQNLIVKVFKDVIDVDLLP